ncbi:MAG: hypothetical protein MJ252_26760, partial [archaeon]|nr:hypothetical protein [archaeon]
MQKSFNRTQNNFFIRNKNTPIALHSPQISLPKELKSEEGPSVLSQETTKHSKQNSKPSESLSNYQTENSNIKNKNLISIKKGIKFKKSTTLLSPEKPPMASINLF